MYSSVADSKDLTAQELGEEKQQQLEDQMEDSTDNHENNNNNNINNEDEDEDAVSEQPEETNPEQDQNLGETEMEQDHEPRQRDLDELMPNSPSTPPRSPSSPQLIPKLEQPATPPEMEMEMEMEPEPELPKLPKLRLNALLASDPALKPDAKELNLPEARLLAPPPLIKPETQPQPEMVEPLMKPARFMCLPCSIAFSSPSTLEAHQAYYCSHRIKETEEDQSGGGEKSAAGAGSGAAGSGAGAGGGSSEPPAKMARTGKQYACSQCSYSADKKVSLNRHMRMHQTSPAAPILPSLPNLVPNGLPPAGVAPTSLEESSSQQQTDRYCSDCDIRFNNIKTYRAHKQHYCSSRRSEGQLTPKPDASPGVGSGGGAGGGGSGGGSGGSASGGVSAQAAAPGKVSPQARNKTPTPAMVAAAAAAAAAAASLQAATPQPFLALPTHPIIIVPCSLIRAASIIPGPLPTPSSGIVNPESTCYTVDNGTIKPLATALLGTALAGNVSLLNNPTGNLASLPIPALEPERPSAPSSAAEANEPKSSPQEPKRKEAGGTRESAPLDLSLRRSPISLNSLSLRQRHLRTALLDVEEVLLAGVGGAGKENVDTSRRGGSMTPEQIVCAPSLPSSPSMSPSPKRRVISPRSSGAGSAASMSPPGLNVAVPHLLDMRSMLPADFGLSESLLAKTNPELALKLAAAAAAAALQPAPPSAQQGGGNSVPSGAAGGAQQPQIYVKQGVSKCKECNIVFCKYENYLAHKQHYCSARNQEGSGEGDSKSAVSPSNPGAGGSGGGGVGGAASSVETTPVAYQQLICAACGIKYTSLDNLRAHQNYYCPKGGAAAAAAANAANAGTPTDTVQLAIIKEKCGKCKTLHEIGLPCPAPANAPLTAPTSNSSSQPASNSVNKCPVCGVVSPTAALARKHMEMHGTVKAFRCSICQYKGNTLRGMRTHIRTHFDKKTSDVNEEHYMTCIFEDEGSTGGQELPSAAIAAAAASLESLDHPPQLFNCDYCNYASTYKGNVLRHMKLLHPHVAISSPSISPESREHEVVSNSTPNQHSNDGSNGEAASFHIKTEPLDVPSTLSLVHENNNSPVPVPVLTPTPHIKAEPLDTGMDVVAAGLVLPPAPVSSPLGNASVAAAAAAAAAEVMKKYCSACDISFNYVKTFLAHKQFYCKAKPQRPEGNDSPSPNHLGGGAVAVGLGMVGAMVGGQQKNKENLQEAAI
ncbi:hypothetical protein KR009_000979 [Drosophila setifemur]|nr:hypothetical protein KR009_000979 [Drosophila setifemur]